MEIQGLTSAATAQMQARIHDDVNTQDSFQSALDSAMENKDKTKLRKACVDFEGYFIQMMMREMRKTVDSSGGILPKGQAEEVFEGMLDEEFAKSAAQGKGIGLADVMYNQLEKSI